MKPYKNDMLISSFSSWSSCNELFRQTIYTQSQLHRGRKSRKDIIYINHVHPKSITHRQKVKKIHHLYKPCTPKVNNTQTESQENASSIKSCTPKVNYTQAENHEKTSSIKPCTPKVNYTQVECQEKTSSI